MGDPPRRRRAATPGEPRRPRLLHGARKPPLNSESEVVEPIPANERREKRERRGIPSARAGNGARPVSADRPPARPRPDRQRRAALPRRMGASRPDRAERAGRDRPRLDRDGVPHPDVLALPRPHHNSMFESRRANSSWGHLLGFLLFTPYRWWQRQHSIHHAHTGDLDHRGVGEINTMTLDEYESLPSAAAGVPPLPQPPADAACGTESGVHVRAPRSGA